MWATSYTVGPQLYHNTLRGIIVMKGTYFSLLLFWLTFVRVKLFVTMMGVRCNSSPFSFLIISGWIQFDNIVFSVSIFRLQYVKNTEFFSGQVRDKKIAGIENCSEKAMNPIRYIQNVLTNRQYFWHFFWMMLLGECALGCLFIRFVPCMSLFIEL